MPTIRSRTRYPIVALSSCLHDAGPETLTYWAVSAAPTQKHDAQAIVADILMYNCDHLRERGRVEPWHCCQRLNLSGIFSSEAAIAHSTSQLSCLTDQS